MLPTVDTSRAQTRAPAPSPASPSSFDQILEYIGSGWDRLTRDMNSCKSLEDPKVTDEPVLYLPAKMAIPPHLVELRKHCAVDIEWLPEEIAGPGQIDVSKIKRKGLLYLEHPYVVPGGQFNEMYGWDSYFIIRGLLRDKRTALAKGMVENFFFEIEHYGGVLNANRTYYLTRSQPPFLTSMILAVYQAEKDAGQDDLPWLQRAYGLAARDYQQWVQDPHLAGDTGLSRYFGRGDGPVPEIIGDPTEYYRGAAHYFLLHKGLGGPDLQNVDGRPPANNLVFDVAVCDDQKPGAREQKCSATDHVALSDDFYKGDRSMRESGFDVTFRFGPFGAETHHYAAVCLNSLLYKTEQDLEQIAALLGKPEEAAQWRAKAAERQANMVRYLWDAQSGLFFDYDFQAKARSEYKYATTFYPLWAGLASNEQAAAVAAAIGTFEQPGGLAMSTYESQAQWDLPYGWAPVQLLAVEGLRRYGYNADADRIAAKFLTTVLRNFEKDHTIREKYDVVTASHETHIAAGYKQNEIGFGWTNATFLELLHESSPAVRVQLQSTP
jgi:alpha,alpha-trehalase